MLAQQYRALVVDDDPIARRMVGMALGQENFNCVYAFDGEDALQRMTTEQFDLVVTDLCMPNVDGHALAAELLSRKNGPVLTVHSCVDDPTTTRDLMTRGVDDIVYKPANYEAFAAKMGVLVRRRKGASSQMDTTATAGPQAWTDMNSRFSTLEKVVSPNTQCSERSTNSSENGRQLASVQHLFPQPAVAYEVYSLSNTKEATLPGLSILC